MLLASTSFAQTKENSTNKGLSAADGKAYPSFDRESNSNNVIFRTDISATSKKKTIFPKKVPYEMNPMTSDRKLAKSVKLPRAQVSPISAIQKTPEEEISDIEREIEQINNSNDSMKNQKVEKLEKLLERKKWLKFTKDQSKS